MARRPVDPSEAASHSGRLLLRMPPELHAELARRSDAERVSLNQFIVGALTRAVAGAEPGAPAPPDRLSPSVRRALVANAIAVALAAGTAIVLLVLALR